MKHLFLLLIVAVVCIAGCDLANPKPRKEEPTPPPPVEPEPEKPAPKPEPTAKPESVTVELKPGFTGKGQYGQGTGEKPADMITVPISQYFTVRERILLMTIQDAENKYKAANDDKLPETQDEYMEKVIKGSGVQLPDLSNGERYVYDPAQQKLMIEKPK